MSDTTLPPPETDAVRKDEKQSFFRKEFGRVSLDEKINFARHLGLIVKAGIPILKGLKIVRNQGISRYFRSIVDQLIRDVDNGRPLSDGLERYRRTFGEFFINVIRVGEESGTLAQNFFYIADELKKSKILRQKVRSAMIYPVVVLIATFAIVGFLTFFMFPKIISVFSGLNIELPVTTRALISIVDFLRAYGIWLFLGIVAFVIALRIAVRYISPFRYIVHKTMLYIPVFSDLVISLNMANFTRILGLLLKGGVRIVEAVSITGDTFRNAVYKKAFREIANEVKRGEQLAHYISGQRKLFPPLAGGMIAVGEQTGNLEENFFYLADYYSEEVENKLERFTSLLEPALLLLMGVMVGFVAVSIITPIYSVTQGVRAN